MRWPPAPPRSPPLASPDAGAVDSTPGCCTWPAPTRWASSTSPAVAFFIDRVAQLSGGRLRIALDERWARGATAREAALLRDVAHGRADLGWAHTSSFDRIGVDSFQALQAPLLIDRDATQDAVIHSPLAAQMLAGTRGAGLEGLALLAGPLTPAGRRQPAAARRRRSPRRPHRGPRLGPRRGRRTRPPQLLQTDHRHAHLPALRRRRLRAGPPGALEDDPDTVFFDRYGGECDAQGAACARVGPWLAANATLWPRTAVLVGNPQRLRDLDARERAWVTEAAKQAATYSTTRDGDDARTLSELCAGGVRVTEMPRAALARLRQAWRPVYRRLEARPDARAALREIRRLRAQAPAATPLPPVPGCSRPSPVGDDAARGVRSTLPDGIYRVRITDADLRAVGANRAGDRTGTATLTLRRRSLAARVHRARPQRSHRHVRGHGAAHRLGHRREHTRRGIRLDRRARRRRARIPRRVGRQPGHDTGDLRLAHHGGGSDDEDPVSVVTAGMVALAGCGGASLTKVGPVGSAPPSGPTAHRLRALRRREQRRQQRADLPPDACAGAVRQLTHVTGGAFAPAWSPDGTRIAFERGASAGRHLIYSMNPDGTDLRPLATGAPQRVAARSTPSRRTRPTAGK